MTSKSLAIYVVGGDMSIKYIINIQSNLYLYTKDKNISGLDF